MSFFLTVSMCQNAPIENFKTDFYPDIVSAYRPLIYRHLAQIHGFLLISFMTNEIEIILFLLRFHI